MNSGNGIHPVDESAPFAPMRRGAFRLDTLEVPRASLWRDARRACDDALARGHAFVALLRQAAAFADAGLLSEQDRARAARYRFASDRDNFTLGRSMVHYLVRPHGASAPCQYSLGPYGKPFLPGAPAYNVSHSGDWVACAVSHREPIGVDVETFERLRDFHELLPSIAHPDERRLIEQAATERQAALFKRLWTRKEAVLKATGTGLSEKLGAIDVRLGEDQPLLSEPAALRLIDLPADEAQAAIALALDPALPGLVVLRLE
jgi:4'-phosphopantetheinyl transferase